MELVVNELQGLAESDQELVLAFLHDLKRKHSTTEKRGVRQGRNPALKMKNGRLVFTGKLEAPHVDWLRVVREERDQEVVRRAPGLPLSR